MDWTSWLDVTALVVGLVYLLLEYRASIYVWIAGIIMPAIDLFLYWDKGLYGDFGLAVYYLLASVYGFLAWKFWRRSKETSEATSSSADVAPSTAAVVTADATTGSNGGELADASAASELPAPADGNDDTSERPITHFPLRLLLPTSVAFLAIWVLVWYFLQQFTNSTVPVSDSLTNALSIVGMWMLARKYVEQWIVWIVADAIYVWLYAYKALPFKASLYAFYIIVAFFGIRSWTRKISTTTR